MPDIHINEPGLTIYLVWHNDWEQSDVIAAFILETEAQQFCQEQQTLHPPYDRYSVGSIVLYAPGEYPTPSSAMSSLPRWRS